MPIAHFRWEVDVMPRSFQYINISPVSVYNVTGAEYKFAFSGDLNSENGRLNF